MRQELWGVLIAYTLLRRWMRSMAAHVQVEPQRISFHTASYAIVNLLAVPMDSAGTLPKQLAALLAQSRHFVLPPRRTGALPGSSKTRFQIPNEKCQGS